MAPEGGRHAAAHQQRLLEYRGRRAGLQARDPPTAVPHDRVVQLGMVAAVSGPDGGYMSNLLDFTGKVEEDPMYPFGSAAEVHNVITYFVHMSACHSHS